MDFGRPWVDHVPIIVNSSASIVRAVRILADVDQDAMLRAGLQTAAAYDWNIVGARWNELLTGAPGLA
jgi:hypothetical protein